MPSKKVAKIDFVKAVAGVSFATLAAIGGSTGNPLLAGLAAVPAAGLSAHNNLGNLLTKLKSQKENYLEIPPPPWWIHDIRTWQNLCVEIGNHLPAMLQIMQDNMRQEEQVVTRDRVQQYFIEALVVQYLSWEHDIEQKKRVGEFLATPFLQKLDEVLMPLIDQIQQEGMLIDERRTAVHTEQTVRMLEKIHEQVSGTAKPATLGDEETAILRRRYYEALYTYWKMLDFKGILHVDMNRPISIPLAEVFILPEVLPGIPEYETLERETEEFIYGGHARKAKLTPTQREPLPSVLGKHPRLVLLGDPGSGKSTLLRYLLVQLVQGSDAFAAIFPELSEIAALVPLYMPLAAFAEVLLSNAPGTRTLEDFLPVYLHDNYLAPYVRFVQTQLEKGTLFLLFDGLDEIPDASLRMSVVRHIEMFTQSHAANRFIVSSRIVGYKEAPLSSTEYQAYTLADFNEEQVKAFTQRWCPAYERWVNEVWDSQALDHAATKEAEKLFDATQCKPAVKRLAVNPLLLTILALLQRQGIELPSHRVDLFDLCAMTLIDTWVRAKGQKTHFTRNELIKILRPLSFWMHEHPAIGAIPGEEMHEQIVKQLIARSIHEYDAEKLAEQFLQTVRGKTGILIERGKDRYGFLHLTFEEYFAAMELEKRKDRNDFIRNHLHDPRWREVILLTVGAIGILRSNEEEVTELVYDVIRNAGSTYEWALHRDLLFAGLCLADDVGIRVDRENEIIEQIVYLSLTTPHTGLRAACSTVLSAWSETRIGEKAVDLVLPLLRQLVIPPDSQKTLIATNIFQERLNKHIDGLVLQHRAELRRHLRFQLTIILACLQELDSIDYVSNLIDLISDENLKEVVRASCRNDTLSIVDILLTTLSDPDETVKMRVVSALGFLNNTSPKVIDALLTALSDHSFYTRRAAISAIGRLGVKHPLVYRALLFALGDYSFIKSKALEVLLDLDEILPQDIDALLKLLVDTDSRLTRKAASSVFKRIEKKDKDAEEAILSSSTEAKEKVAQLLGQLSNNPTQITRVFLNAFSNLTNLKEVCIRVLGYVGQDRPRIIEILLSLLPESDSYIKGAVINALEQIGTGPPQIIEELISTLSDPHWVIRRDAVKALAKLGKDQPRVIDAILPLCSDADNDVREAVAIAFGQLASREPVVLDELVSALDDPEGNVRLAAASTLMRLKREEPIVLDTLLSSLSDPDEEIWEAATDSLVQLSKDQPRVIGHIKEALFNDSSDIWLQKTMSDYKRKLLCSLAEKALSLLKDIKSNRPEIIDVLFTAITDRDFYVQGEASNALGRLGRKDSHVIDRLLLALSDSKWSVRGAAVRAFGQLEKSQPRVIDALITALSDDPHPSVRRSAADTLGKLGKDQSRVINALLEGLDDNGPESGLVRQGAALALGQLGDEQPQTIDALLHVLLTDASLWGKLGAAIALGKCGKNKPEIVDTLLSALSSDDWAVRGMATTALGYLEDKHPRIFEILLPMVTDPLWFVRGCAIEALGKLDEKFSSSVDEVLRALSDVSSYVRYEAASTSKDCGDNTRIIEALIRTLSDTAWSVRGAAAYALASSYHKHEAIGSRIEYLLRQFEPIAFQEEHKYYLTIFDALRVVAEKAASSK